MKGPNMNSNELIESTAKQLAEMAGLVSGRPWGADKGKPRIYLKSRKDMTVYFAFEDYPTGDDDDLLGGASLKVYIDDCGQSPKWYASQKRIVIQNRMQHGLALAAWSAGDRQLAEDIMDADDFDGEQIDEASGHLANGRLAEARESLGL